MRLMDEGYGTYLEIAYEWSWEEAMDYLEILDIKQEFQRRAEVKQKAQSRASR